MNVCLANFLAFLAPLLTNVQSVILDILSTLPHLAANSVAILLLDTISIQIQIAVFSAIQHAYNAKEILPPVLNVYQDTF